MAKNPTKKELEAMKKAELLKLCEERRLETPSKATNDTLRELITKDIAEEKARRAQAEKAKAEAAAQAKKAKEEAEKKAKAEKSAKKAKPARQEPNKRQPTGKELGRAHQLKIREEKLENAEKLYGEPVRAAMHGADRLIPKIYKNKIFEDERRKLVSPEDLELAQSRDDAFFTLTGTVEGTGNTERFTDQGRNVEFVYVIVNYKGRTVRIPTYHYWDNFEEKTNPYTIMQHRIGSEVDFNLIYKEDDFDGTPRYYGTRLLAMKIKRCDIWYGQYEDGSWCINNGDEVPAKVVEVWPRTIVVEVAGAEASVPQWELSSQYISNAETQMAIKPGDTIKVVVSDIVRAKLPNDLDSFTYPVKFSASIKAAEPNPQKLYYADYDIGDTRRAIVTNITSNPNSKNKGDSNSFFCQVLGPKPVTVLCNLVEGSGRNGYIPKVDQEVRIRIKKKNDKNFFIYGEIIRVLPNREKGDIVFTV